MGPIISLNVSSANLFLFGQIGAGKSHCGRFLAQNFGLTFYEGDSEITPAMRTAIAGHSPFTPLMRLEFTDLLTQRIATLAGGTQNFCIAQALFKNRERHLLRARFPDLAFVWVQADTRIIAERLSHRSGHVADLAYAEFANPYFETPDFAHHVIENDGDEASLHRQLSVVLKASESIDGNPTNRQ